MFMIYRQVLLTFVSTKVLKLSVTTGWPWLGGPGRVRCPVKPAHDFRVTKLTCFAFMLCQKFKAIPRE